MTLKEPSTELAELLQSGVPPETTVILSVGQLRGWHASGSTTSLSPHPSSSSTMAFYRSNWKRKFSRTPTRNCTRMFTRSGCVLVQKTRSRPHFYAPCDTWESPPNTTCGLSRSFPEAFLLRVVGCGTQPTTDVSVSTTRLLGEPWRYSLTFTGESTDGPVRKRHEPPTADGRPRSPDPAFGLQYHTAARAWFL